MRKTLKEYFEDMYNSIQKRSKSTYVVQMIMVQMKWNAVRNGGWEECCKCDQISVNVRNV